MQMVQAENFKPMIARAEVRRDGLIIEEGLTAQEWLQGVVGPLRELIGAMEASASWWWGDALAYGDRKYGEMYTQALEGSDYSYGALRNAKFVSERIPLSCRRDNLTWTHHAEIAAVKDAQEREKWLDRASNEKMSKSELRKAIREAKGEIKDPKNENAGQFGPVEATLELKTFFETQDVTKWNIEQCRYWRNDLRPIAAVYELLVSRLS